MDISLIFPPFYFKESYNPYNPVAPFPPLGLASIAAVLEAKGFKVNIFDCEVTKTSIHDLVKIIKKKPPKAIGITTLTSMIHRSLLTGRVLKKAFPDIPIIFGGPHVTIFPEQTLRNNAFIDFIIYGEGEYTTVELLDEIEKFTPNFSQIRGIGYKEDGKTIINPRRPYIKNIDELPLPARHLLPMKTYKPSKWVVKKPPGTLAVVSRGCPYQCTFCSKAIWGQTVRERGAEKVVEEIIDLKEKYRINDVIFGDDTFTIHKKRVMRICELLRKNRIDISWSCLTRVDCVDKELLSKMKQSGCHQVGYGVESGNQEILNIIKKGITIKQIKTAFKIAKEVGLDTRAFIIYGLPGETEDKARETLSLLKELDPDYANVYIYTPFPGTELFEIAKTMGTIENFQWSQFNKFSPIFIPDGRKREDIIKIYKQTIKEFYLNLHYIKKRLKKLQNFYDLLKHLSLGFQLIVNLLTGKFNE
ncbi:MAG: B12-binding domain-containing radical SAM protein [Candidatus Helarchaeota archaeon]